MIRIIALQLLFFLLPFIVYAFWLYFTRRLVNRVENWRPHVFWLVIAGLALTIAAFVTMAAFSGAPPDGTYTPPQIKDGVVIPGEIK